MSKPQTAPQNNQKQAEELAALATSIKEQFVALNAAFNQLNLWKDGFLRKQYSASIKSEFSIAYSRFLRSKLSLNDPLERLITECQSKAKLTDNKPKTIVLDDKKNERANSQDLLKTSLRQIELLSAQLNKAKADKRLSTWEFVIKKAVRWQQSQRKNERAQKYSVSRMKLTHFDQVEIDSAKLDHKKMLKRQYCSLLNLSEILRDDQD